MKYLLTTLILYLLSSSVFAGCATNACQGVGADVLTSVYPNGTGNIYLQAGTNRENLDCSLVEGQYMVLKSDHPLFDAIYSTILTALMGQKGLIVRIKNKSPICEVSYVRMFI